MFFLSMEAAIYRESLDCPYCTSYTGSSNANLRYHLKTRHEIAENVNRKRDSSGNLCVTPSESMGHCPTCNLYLDPGVTLQTSTHTSTTLHIWKQSLRSSSSQAIKSTTSSSSSSAALSGTSITYQGHSDEDDGPPGWYGGYDEGEGQTENLNQFLGIAAPQALSVPFWQGASHSSDWFAGRNDLLDPTIDPIIGSVWSAPFNYEGYAPTDDFSVKILDPDNSARYRVVYIRFAPPGSAKEDVSY